MNIGIIGAFDAEIEKFIEIFNLNKDENTNKSIYIGKYKDKNIIVARSGIGKVNSAAMTQYLIDNYDINLIINSGCAGSLINSVEIMDVVISSYVTYHDFNPTRIMEFSVPDSGKIKADASLIELTEKACKKLETNNYWIAPICSGDCFVTDDKQRDFIRVSTGAYAVDMESGSIGHICKLNNIPFVSIRTISDFADGKDDFEDVAAYKSSHLVSEIIKSI